MGTSIRVIKTVIHEDDEDAEVVQINELEASGLHDATYVVDAAQVIDQKQCCQRRENY